MRPASIFSNIQLSNSRVKQEDYWPAIWRMTEKVKYALDDAGITIPFPQMDVHFDK